MRRTNLSSDVLTVGTAQSWLTLISGSFSCTQRERIIRIINRRQFSNIMYELRLLLPDLYAQDVYRAISFFLEGIWVHCAMQQDDFSLEESKNQLIKFVDNQLLIAEKNSKWAST
ncbi:TetR family transcriptional regulator C-terminal domain-containing protein [Amphritea sp. 1_MG-2023]|uniref:TetR family transcriptional regulator C-terminal domain-containing protein n=1 Tax=Amphritea sp. 1_MG-2023 TaxID=3062670 RepID=UPI0034A5C5DD